MTAAATVIATDEQVLVTRSKAGDRQAYEQLYRNHHSRIYALCWRMCSGDKALAEDLLQDAFVHAWRKLDGFRGESAFGTWLHRLTVNVVLGDKRRKKRQLQVIDGDSDRPDIEDSDEAMEGADQDMERAIARLPDRARDVLVLYSLEGYTHEEISRATGMAVGSSKAQLHRARSLLKQWLVE